MNHDCIRQDHSTGSAAFPKLIALVDPSTIILKMSESMDPNTQSASASAETNLTWTTTDQEMLDDLTRQGQTIAEIVTHSQGLEDPTRLVNDASSLADSTLCLKSDIMSSGKDWRDRTKAFINKFRALSPALAREMARPTQVATTNCPEQSMETELRCAAERCHNAVVVLRDKCSVYKASNTAVSDTRLGKELDEYFCSITNLQSSLKTVATSWIGEFLPRAVRTSVPE